MIVGYDSTAKLFNQALYCLRRALAMRPDDTDALWDQALLLKDQGNHSKVCTVLLYCRTYAHLCHILDTLRPWKLFSDS